jgi:hypothetical protein
LAEAGASLAGGVGPAVLKALRARQALQPLLNAQEVKAIGDAGYQNPLLRDTTIAPAASQTLARDMGDALSASRSKFTQANAPEVHDAIDALATGSAPKSGIGPASPVSIEDLHLLRKDLGRMGQETRDFKPTEQATAAGKAKRVLDNYLDNIKSSDVVKGDPIDAVQALRDANGNWRAQSGAQSVGNLIGNAIEDNNAANSAMNLGNRIRQTFKPLLKNDAAKLRAMGHGDDVIDAVRTVTKGDPLTNALRYGSNVLGGGGGIGSAIIGHGLASAGGGAAGYEEGGLPGFVLGAAAGMLPGQALRVAANARTLKAAQSVQNALLAKAPANAPILAANNVARAVNRAAMDQAVVRGSAAVAPIVLHRLLSKANGH